MGFPIWQPPVNARDMMVHPEESLFKAIEGLKTGLQLSLAIKSAKMEAERHQAEMKIKEIEQTTKQLQLQQLQAELESNLLDYAVMQKQEEINSLKLQNKLLMNKLDAQIKLPLYNDNMRILTEEIKKKTRDITNPLELYAEIKDQYDSDTYKQLKADHLVLFASYDQRIPDPDTIIDQALSQITIPVDVVKTTEREGTPNLVEGIMLQYANQGASQFKSSGVTTTKKMVPVAEVIRGAIAGDTEYQEALKRALSNYSDERKAIILKRLYNEEDFNVIYNIIVGQGNKPSEATQTPQIIPNTNIPLGPRTSTITTGPQSVIRKIDPTTISPSLYKQLEEKSVKMNTK